MIVVFISILVGIILWVTFRAGRQQGQSEGFASGLSEGIKRGREEGKQLGLKAGIKEHMISTLIEAPPISGIGDDLQQQVKQEIINELNAKDKKKNVAQKPSDSFIQALWEEYGGWLLVIGFIFLLAFLFD